MSNSLKNRVNKGVLDLKPYEPGKPIEETEKELGLENIVKLASNENPIGMSPKAHEVVSALTDLNRYPDGNASAFKEKVASSFDVLPTMVTVGNGSNDIIEFIAKCFLSSGDTAIYSKHGFAIYPLAIKASGAEAIKVEAKNWGHDLEAMADAIQENTKVIFIASPNNPTGTASTLEEIEKFLTKIPDNIVVLIDQAYFEYVENEEFKVPFKLVEKFKNLIISRSFSKAHGLAAFRLGFAISSEEIADYLNRVRQPFNTNSLALAAGIEAIEDEEHIFKSVKLNKLGLEMIKAKFDDLGFEYINSHGNFISFDSKNDSDKSFDFFLQKGIILRSLKVYEMPKHLRVSIGTEEEMQKFTKTLEEYARTIEK
jgi:histidinol-phosphate aminotransferase